MHTHTRLTDAQMVKQFLSRRVKRDDVVAVPISRGLWDIFTGHGWKLHHRYRCVKGTWMHVSGNYLPSGFKYPV